MFDSQLTTAIDRARALHAQPVIILPCTQFGPARRVSLTEMHVTNDRLSRGSRSPFRRFGPTPRPFHGAGLVAAGIFLPDAGLGLLADVVHKRVHNHAVGAGHRRCRLELRRTQRGSESQWHARSLDAGDYRFAAGVRAVLRRSRRPSAGVHAGPRTDPCADVIGRGLAGFELVHAAHTTDRAY